MQARLRKTASRYLQEKRNVAVLIEEKMSGFLPGRNNFYGPLKFKKSNSQRLIFFSFELIKTELKIEALKMKLKF